MNEAPVSTMLRPEVMERQEIRKFTGEALRVAIPWSQHPAWSIIAERLGDAAPKPPPAFTDSDVRAMISGGGHLLACPNCGHALVQKR